MLTPVSFSLQVRISRTQIIIFSKHTILFGEFKIAHMKDIKYERKI